MRPADVRTRRWPSQDGADSIQGRSRNHLFTIVFSPRSTGAPGVHRQRLGNAVPIEVPEVQRIPAFGSNRDAETGKDGRASSIDIRHIEDHRCYPLPMDLELLLSQRSGGREPVAVRRELLCLAIAHHFHSLAEFRRQSRERADPLLDPSDKIGFGSFDLRRLARATRMLGLRSVAPLIDGRAREPCAGNLDEPLTFLVGEEAFEQRDPRPIDGERDTWLALADCETIANEYLWSMTSHRLRLRGGQCNRVFELHAAGSTDGWAIQTLVPEYRGFGDAGQSSVLPGNGLIHDLVVGIPEGHRRSLDRFGSD